MHAKGLGHSQSSSMEPKHKAGGVSRREPPKHLLLQAPAARGQAQKRDSEGRSPQVPAHEMAQGQGAEARGEQCPLWVRSIPGGGAPRRLLPRVGPSAHADPAASSGFLMEARCGPGMPAGGGRRAGRRAAFQAPLPPRPQAEGAEHRHQPRSGEGVAATHALPRSPQPRNPLQGAPPPAELRSPWTAATPSPTSAPSLPPLLGDGGRKRSAGGQTRRCLAGAGMEVPGAGPARTLARREGRPEKAERTGAPSLSSS